VHLQPIGDLIDALDIGNQHMGELLEKEAAHDATQRENAFMEVKCDSAMLVIAGLRQPLTGAIKRLTVAGWAGRRF